MRSTRPRPRPCLRFPPLQHRRMRLRPPGIVLRRVCRVRLGAECGGGGGRDGGMAGCGRAPAVVHDELAGLAPDELAHGGEGHVEREDVVVAQDFVDFFGFWEGGSGRVLVAWLRWVLVD